MVSRSSGVVELAAVEILNESVNFDKQCIFIAVPKTGTTSVRTQLRQKGKPIIPNPHLGITQVRDSLYVYCLKKALGVNGSFPTAGVLCDREVREEAMDIFNAFFKFSAVRNPWARVVSLYFRREGVQVKDRGTFEKFCEQHIYDSDTCVHPTLHVNQLDWLCDGEGNCLMDYIYKVEDFDSALIEIAERTNGRVNLSNRRFNQNPDSYSSRYREMYSDRGRRLVAANFEKDIDYFKYTF